MPRLTRAAIVALGYVLLVDCGDAGDPPVVEVIYYRDADSRQCEPSKLTSTNLSALATELANGGVAVSSMACAVRTDTRYAAFCGGVMGDIWLVGTERTPSEIMRAQGFAPITEVRGYSEVACK